MSWTTLPRSEPAGGIAWHVAGEGPALVLLHGVGLRAEAWAAGIPALATRCRVYAIDLPGHGASARLPVDDPELADYTAAVVGFIDGVVGEPAVLAGHSMGAMIALELASRHPSACRAVAAFCSIFQRPPEARAAVLARAGQLRAGDDNAKLEAPVVRWFGDPVPPEQEAAADACRTWLRNADRRGYADAYRTFAGADGPCPEDLARLQVPALFAAGENDPNSTPAMSRAMAVLAPRGEAVVIAGAGHMLPMTHADVTTQLVANLLGRVGAQPEPGVEVA